MELNVTPQSTLPDQPASLDKSKYLLDQSKENKKIIDDKNKEDIEETKDRKDKVHVGEE